MTSLGDFVVRVAYGAERTVTLSEVEARQVRRGLIRDIEPAVQAVRLSQRKALAPMLDRRVF